MAKKVRVKELNLETTNEWKRLKQLNHKNIVNSTACFFDPDKELMIIIMEYCECKFCFIFANFFTDGDVGRLIQYQRQAGGYFPETDVMKLLIQTCKALSHAHKKGTLHLDIKPANLFITASGDLKLGDLGVALNKSVMKKYYGK